DLSALPSGTTGSDVVMATIKVFVNKVTANGSVELHRVSTGAANGWGEAIIKASNEPALESTAIDTVAVTTSSKNEYLSFDATAIVMGWLDGSFDDNGVALVPKPTDGPSIYFD